MVQKTNKSKKRKIKRWIGFPFRQHDVKKEEKREKWKIKYLIGFPFRQHYTTCHTLFSYCLESSSYLIVNITYCFWNLLEVQASKHWVGAFLFPHEGSLTLFQSCATCSLHSSIFPKTPPVTGVSPPVWSYSGCDNWKRWPSTDPRRRYLSHYISSMYSILSLLVLLLLRKKQTFLSLLREGDGTIIDSVIDCCTFPITDIICSAKCHQSR